MNFAGENRRLSALGYNPTTTGLDASATLEEAERFGVLQNRLSSSFHEIFDSPKAPRTVLIVPSLSLDQQVMAKVSGVHHYEERMLCLLLLLRIGEQALGRTSD